MLVFGFCGTNSEKIVKQLPSRYKKVILDCDTAKIDDFIDSLSKCDQDIIGLGQYGGRDNTQLRLEQVAKNTFRSKVIGRTSIVQLDSISEPVENVKFGFGMGNSWCNLVSYKIANKYPNKHYSFIHIPKNYSISKAVAELEALLSD